MRLEKEINRIIDCFLNSELSFKEFSHRFSDLYIEKISDLELDDLPTNIQDFYSEVNDVIEYTDESISTDEISELGTYNASISLKKIKELKEKFSI